MIKFVDDTYLIIPASNCHTRSDNIEHWAQINNLKLNRDKSKEIIFTDNRKKQFQALFESQLSKFWA